jgi:hypothetical protein
VASGKILPFLGNTENTQSGGQKQSAATRAGFAQRIPVGYSLPYKGNLNYWVVSPSVIVEVY